MAGISAAYLAGIAAMAAAGPVTGVLYAAGPASLAAALMSLLLFCRKAGGPAPVYAVFFFLGIFTFCSRELCGAIVWQRPEAAQTAFELLKAAIADSGLGNGALVTALLTGDRSGLSAGTTKAFREAGAAHILALSGLHLGIIYGLLK